MLRGYRIAFAAASEAGSGSVRYDRDVVDQPGAAEPGGGEQARRAVERSHCRQIGGIAQFQVIGDEAGLAQRGEALLNRRRYGFGMVADAYVREARAAYTRWGAFGKLAQIDRRTTTC